MPKSESTGSAERVARRRWPPLNLIILAGALLAASVFGYREFRERVLFLHEEDARIRADMVTVASRVAGWVTRVAVAEGQTVEFATVLLEIDRRDAELAVQEFEAQRAAVAAERARLAAER
ncbi:MAG: biotin/lipoyl-binding protein, partial [Burkholderiales bacterium]|nr:biotin/lipoyl-binding protein [Burkholderiales bacterium]